LSESAHSKIKKDVLGQTRHADREPRHLCAKPISFCCVLLENCKVSRKSDHYLRKNYLSEMADAFDIEEYLEEQVTNPQEEPEKEEKKSR
jgi:hypothetical protein